MKKIKVLLISLSALGTLVSGAASQKTRADSRANETSSSTITSDQSVSSSANANSSSSSSFMQGSMHDPEFYIISRDEKTHTITYSRTPAAPRTNSISTRQQGSMHNPNDNIKNDDKKTHTVIYSKTAPQSKANTTVESKDSAKPVVSNKEKLSEYNSEKLTVLPQTSEKQSNVIRIIGVILMLFAGASFFFGRKK
ncbi:LPXTG cell wall anchor domain-containing protein [Pediococcus inopinatus]|uniref:LPXTG cell wall anchor domain-containing protein n=1 Tax=Pediococcus inopinatus TaxID=114090 RepID=A0ABZ0Q631_9LACO|nr:LPXTG cell wall anchor domain-containing protein [Pediococcus inopinatus]WPC19929.1 LPXTG cell wall anchor domain-containing protein [Pediococcus inopinatus]WPC21630.1 LPXTG cell wall anchor domain-containing protein [Pediococcus inopinatus]WPP09439.1 LPXTG cell wall anchor domain-containing protein [Pediococcus inopinatus]